MAGNLNFCRAAIAADLTLQRLARHSSFLLQRRGRGERNLQQVVGAGHFGADAHAGRGAALGQPFGPQGVEGVEGGTIRHVLEVNGGHEQAGFVRPHFDQRNFGLCQQGAGLAFNVGAAVGHFHKKGGVAVHHGVGPLGLGVDARDAGFWHGCTAVSQNTAQCTGAPLALWCSLACFSLLPLALPRTLARQTLLRKLNPIRPSTEP